MFPNSGAEGLHAPSATGRNEGRLHGMFSAGRPARVCRKHTSVVGRGQRPVAAVGRPLQSRAPIKGGFDPPVPTRHSPSNTRWVQFDTGVRAFALRALYGCGACYDRCSDMATGKLLVLER